jgi:hypothetical protein
LCRIRKTILRFVDGGDSQELELDTFSVRKDPDLFAEVFAEFIGILSMHGKDVTARRDRADEFLKIV